MITEQELHAAIVTIEQHIKDCKEDREKYKHDTVQLKKYSTQMFESKVKLQVLHYATGLTQMISEERLKKDIEELSVYFNELKSPREVDMFVQEDEKAIVLGQQVMALKLMTLNFIAGIEKKII